jgi:hypothetical protein
MQSNGFPFAPFQQRCRPLILFCVVIATQARENQKEKRRVEMMQSLEALLSMAGTFSWLVMSDEYSP